MITDVCLNQKGVNVCEHTIKTVLRESFGELPPERVQDKMNKGMEENLNGNYPRLYQGYV